MVAVADTSPVCYLILIGEIDLLFKFFNKVLVPPAVITELLHEDAPQPVRDWVRNLPSWISISGSIAGNVAGLERLQVGERDAILLAESIKAGIILLDEKPARRAALNRGLRITGTLGVLSEAAARGLVDLPASIHRLQKTNFRYSPALLKAALDRFGSR